MHCTKSNGKTSTCRLIIIEYKNKMKRNTRFFSLEHLALQYKVRRTQHIGIGGGGGGGTKISRS